MRTTSTDEPQPTNPIRARKSTVMTSWIAAVQRDVPDANRRRTNALLEPIDAVLERIADWVEGSVDRVTSLCAAVDAHVDDRFRHGFAVESVAIEYVRLRRCLLVELTANEHATELDIAIEHALAHAMRRFASRREEVRERYIGALAHDLRSPLACVMMASDRMQRMVSDVLAWARSQGDTFPVALRADDFGTILRGVVDEARIAHGDESIACDIHGDLHGEFDRDRVHQAVTNLVRNAIEHGSGAAELHASEIEDGTSIQKSGS